MGRLRVCTETEKMLQDRLMKEIAIRNNCEVKCDISLHTVWLHDEKFTNEFRYVVILNTIIVSRVCFTNRRKGCMTACLEVLKDFSSKLGYEIINIQSVETFEMMKWCEKMNFIPKDFNMIIKDLEGRDVCVGDYDLKV